MSDFYKDLQRGRVGEVAVIRAFEKLGYAGRIQDVTKWPDWQTKDVDLLLDDYGTERRLEVKTDGLLHKTGNVCLEVWRNNTNKPGWFKYSEATHFVFCDMVNKVAYVCREYELKQRVKELHDYGKLHSRELNRCLCYLINVEANKDIFQTIHLD